jgi:hypothetical protein
MRCIRLGGDIGPGFWCVGDSEVFIYASSFQIDGVPVGYGPEKAFLFRQRYGTMQKAMALAYVACYFKGEQQ